MDNLEFNKYKEVVGELNKLGLYIAQRDSTSFTRIFDFEILKHASTDEHGVVKFNNKRELISILKKLTSGEMTKKTTFRIDDDLQRLGIHDNDEFFVRFFAV